MPKDLLTVKEVAKLLGVTPLTVRNWDARGKLAAHRHPLNNYRVYKVADIESIMRELDSSKGVRRSIPKPPEKPQIRKLKIDVY